MYVSLRCILSSKKAVIGVHEARGVLIALQRLHRVYPVRCGGYCERGGTPRLRCTFFRTTCGRSPPATCFSASFSSRFVACGERRGQPRRQRDAQDCYGIR